jgi:hypothetical protein
VRYFDPDGRCIDETCMPMVETNGRVASKGGYELKGLLAICGIAIGGAYVGMYFAADAIIGVGAAELAGGDIAGAFQLHLVLEYGPTVAAAGLAGYVRQPAPPRGISGEAMPDPGSRRDLGG